MKKVEKFIMKRTISVFFALFFLFLGNCVPMKENTEKKSRLVMFVGMDISGSFIQSEYFNDSIRFLARYLYAHLNGIGGLKRPKDLFVGSIGGSKPNEPKTFFPIQIFEDKTIKEIERQLKKIFPKKVQNPFTDYNAFFYQISETVKNRSLILRPISIVMITDGMPDVPGSVGKKNRDKNFRKIKFKPLEQLTRDLTLRVLYTDPVIGMGWQTRVPRKRVKVWTQDARVMVTWKDPKIYLHKKKFKKQTKFFGWVRENIDFKVRSRRIN